MDDSLRGSGVVLDAEGDWLLLLRVEEHALCILERFHQLLAVEYLGEESKDKMEGEWDAREDRMGEGRGEGSWAGRGAVDRIHMAAVCSPVSFL